MSRYSIEKRVAIATEIIKRAVEISRNTPHDVFVNYSPHVDSMSICIHEGGWKSIFSANTSKKEEFFNIYFGGQFGNPDKQLFDIYKRLAELEKDAKK